MNYKTKQLSNSLDNFEVQMYKIQQHYTVIFPSIQIFY